jgi:pimeloyl-ACP methyl ester carboxylesterase
VVLIAPDGLKMNRWYWLATQTGAGNRLFRWTMKRPGWLFGLLRTGNWLGLVNPGIYKFAVHYIDNDRVRQELYLRWTLLRGFRPDITRIRALIAERKIPIGLLYGRYDRIIRWDTGDAFCRTLPAEYCSLVVLDSGHQLLRPGNEGVILSLLSLSK